MGKNVFQVRVIYADTDAMGVVYHTNYIKWFEIGRTEMLRDMGIVYADMESDDFNLPLTEAYCHYLFPARYDNILLVETEIEFARRSRIKFTYEIWDEKHENIHVEGYTLHACTTRQGRMVRLPAEFMEKIDQYLQ